jgi:hypothetical protein
VQTVAKLEKAKAKLARAEVQLVRSGAGSSAA